MDIRVQLFIIVLAILSMAIIVMMVRKRALELRYVLIWLLLGTGILILAIFPGLIDFFSRILGIESPMNMLFFVGFIFSLIIIFAMTVVISRMSVRMKDLAQAIALLNDKSKHK